MTPPRPDPAAPPDRGLSNIDVAIFIVITRRLLQQHSLPILLKFLGANIENGKVTCCGSIINSLKVNEFKLGIII